MLDETLLRVPSSLFLKRSFPKTKIKTKKIEAKILCNPQYTDVIKTTILMGNIKMGIVMPFLISISRSSYICMNTTKPRNEDRAIPPI